MQLWQLPTPWQHWHVAVGAIEAAELIVTAARLVVLDVGEGLSRAEAVSHAWAHLELGHQLAVGGLSDVQESWARQLAALQLDGDEVAA